MKFSKKMMILFAVVLVFALAVPGALAVNDTAVEAGKTATLTFTFSDIYNVDGAFTISDPQNIVSAHSVNISDAGKTSATVSGDRLWASPGAEPVKTSVTVKVTVTVKSGAAAGSTCTVSFSGIYGDANEAPGNEHDVTQSATITVKAGSNSGSASPAPSVSPAPSGSPSPSTSAGNGVDYSKLEKQLAVAEGLYLNDYDDASRVALTNAITAGQKALSSENQDVVSAAAEELNRVIGALVKMDYSRLRTVLDKADTLLVSEQTAILWEQLSAAAAEANALLDSGDQEAVSAAAARLAEIIAQLEKELEVITETSIVVQEVPVATLPTSDFCNMTEHHLWPILSVVSLALNVGLIALVVVYVIRKVKNRKDETPLVDYDIDLDEEV